MVSRKKHKRKLNQIKPTSYYGMYKYWGVWISIGVGYLNFIQQISSNNTLYFKSTVITQVQIELTLHHSSLAAESL